MSYQIFLPLTAPDSNLSEFTVTSFPQYKLALIRYLLATKRFVIIAAVYQSSVLKSRSGGKAIVVWMTR